jgi:putative membrane protein
MDGYGWGAMGFGMIGMVLFWILLIVALVLLTKMLWKSGSGGLERSQEKKPLDILKERYARGEIEKEEFDQKKHDLQ